MGIGCWRRGRGRTGAARDPVPVGLVFGFRFYLTLYQVWEPVTGESALRMMFKPSFSRRRRRAMRGPLFDLFKPSWIGQTLRQTGWNPRMVGYGLLGLLVADLAIAALVLPKLPSR